MKLICLCLLLFGTHASAISHLNKNDTLTVIKALKSRGETVFVVVPKNTEETFFKLAGKGCHEAAALRGVHCLMYGSEAESTWLQKQDIEELIRANVDGIAVASIKKDWLASTLTDEIKRWGKPFVAFDSPLNDKIAKSYIGTNNVKMGQALGQEVIQLRPNGGTYCIFTSRLDSPNHKDRLDGILTALNQASPKHWQNVFGCPIEHYGDFERANRQMRRILQHSKPDVVFNTGGGAPFLPDEYRKTMTPYKEKISSGELIVASIDTSEVQQRFLQEGLSTINVGQSPYEMGEKALFAMYELYQGKTVPAVIYTSLTYCYNDNACSSNKRAN